MMMIIIYKDREVESATYGNQDTNYVVRKTSSNPVTFLVPTNFKNPTISSVSFYYLSFLHGPYVHAFIHRPTGILIFLIVENHSSL